MPDVRSIKETISFSGLGPSFYKGKIMYINKFFYKLSTLSCTDPCNWLSCLYLSAQLCFFLNIFRFTFSKNLLICWIFLVIKLLYWNRNSSLFTNEDILHFVARGNVTDGKHKPKLNSFHSIFSFSGRKLLLLYCKFYFICI